MSVAGAKVLSEQVPERDVKSEQMQIKNVVVELGPYPNFIIYVIAPQNDSK